LVPRKPSLIEIIEYRKYMLRLRAVSTSNAYKTLKGKPAELQTLIKRVADWLKPAEST
jgi:hypothetical protein